MENLVGGFSEDLACLKNYEVSCEEVRRVFEIGFSVNFFLELEAELFVHVHVAFSRPSSAEFLRLKPEVTTLYLVGCVVDKICFRLDECWGFVW